MSSGLYWRPRATGKKELDDRLMFILRDGSFALDAGPREPRVADQSDLSFFRALVDAKVPDAQVIVDALEHNDEIELWLA